MNPSELLVTNTSTPSAQRHQFGNSTTRATVLSPADKALLRRFSTENSVKKPTSLNGPDGRPPMNGTIVLDASSQGFVKDTLQECSELGDGAECSRASLRMAKPEESGARTDRNTVSG